MVAILSVEVIRTQALRLIGNPQRILDPVFFHQLGDELFVIGLARLDRPMHFKSQPVMVLIEHVADHIEHHQAEIKLQPEKDRNCETGWHPAPNQQECRRRRTRQHQQKEIEQHIRRAELTDDENQRPRIEGFQQAIADPQPHHARRQCKHEQQIQDERRPPA